MRANFLSGFAIVLFSSHVSWAACVEDQDFLMVWCMKVASPEEIFIRTLADPNDPNATVWGTHKIYHHDTSAPGDDCNSGEENCQDEDYSYAVININPNWQYTDELGQTWTKTDNERFWDMIYYGYTKVSGLDYTQNCYGYAFGVGNWPRDAEPGVDILLNNPSGAGESVCYSITVDECEAEIAVQQNRRHSIKIISCADCEGPAGTIRRITETREKCRESPIYKKSVACMDDGVQLDNPTTPEIDAFTMYKQNSPP